MPPLNATIRPARPGEGPALTELCIRSKAHWGYDAGFMQAVARLLAIGEREIRARRVLVATGGLAAPEDALAAAIPDAPVGVAAVAPMVGEADKFDLTHLFVAPAFFRRGIGRALVHAAMQLAAGQGALRLAILSDPNAACFYQRLGAARQGDAPSDAIPGRRLPLFELDLGAIARGMAPLSRPHRRPV